MFAALSAVWFLAVVVATPAVHRCPMHDGPTGASMTDMPAHTMLGHGPMTPGDHGPQDAHHDCTCLGTCSMATAALLASPRTTPVAIERFTANAPSSGETAPLASAPARLLPFANGPPPARRA